jgi:hypothetical protein
MHPAPRQQALPPRKLGHAVEHHELGCGETVELDGVRHDEHATPAVGLGTEQHSLQRKYEGGGGEGTGGDSVPLGQVRDGNIVAPVAVDEARHSSAPRDSAHAAAAKNEGGEPSVEAPDALPPLHVHAMQPIKHDAAGQGARAIRDDLRRLLQISREGSACDINTRRATHDTETTGIVKKREREASP